jgi:hypothetical protein
MLMYLYNMANHNCYYHINQLEHIDDDDVDLYYAVHVHAVQLN